MTNRIILNLNTYHGFTVDEALEGAAAAGFRQVELCAVKGWTENVMPETDAAEIARVKEKMAALNLSAVSLGGHCNLMDEERLGDFRKNIALAAEFGCAYIISSAGEAHFGKNEKFSNDILAEHIKSLLPDLQKAGIVLALEVHGPVYGTGSSLRPVVEKVGSDFCGVNYDTGNALFYGGRQCHEEIKECYDMVKHVHLKDKAGGVHEWNFPAPGRGALRLGEFMDFLERKGYRGPYSAEVEYTESFTMSPKTPGDITTANQAAKDSFEFIQARL